MNYRRNLGVSLILSGKLLGAWCEEERYLQGIIADVFYGKSVVDIQASASNLLLI